MGKTHQVKVSNEAVSRASGKTLNQWFSEMETQGFLELSHEEMVRRINVEYGVAPAMAQAIVEAFEHVENRTKDGFEVSVSKTFHYPVNDVYDRALKWFERDNRAYLRPDSSVKKLRCNWLTDDSRIAVHFNSKGKTKTQMVVQHEKLLSEGDVEVMRNFWKERLEQMVESL